MYYVTMYEKYPIYERAEGGYYYEGCSIVWSRSFQEFRKAKRFLRKLYLSYVKDRCEKYWYEKSDHSRFGENGRYIGDGWFITLERTYGQYVHHWHPYC